MNSLVNANTPTPQLSNYTLNAFSVDLPLRFEKRIEIFLGVWKTLPTQTAISQISILLVSYKQVQFITIIINQQQ